MPETPFYPLCFTRSNLSSNESHGKDQVAKPDEADMEKLKGEAEEFYESKSAVQKDVWSLEDVEITNQFMK
jgi:predicted RNA-binding protein with PUA-like domain